MLQQPSEFIMYQKLPLDLSMRSAEVTNLQSDFKDIGLQLQQAQRAVATQSFLFDAYSVKAVQVPSVATAPPSGPGIQGMHDLPLQALYTHPIQAVHTHHQQHHLQQQHQQQQQQHHCHNQHQQQQQQQQQQHHQQRQHLLPFTPPSGMVPTVSWQHQQQQERRGSWFPNWQEVFHGFVVGNEGQQGKQTMAPSIEQKPVLHQGVTVAPPATASKVTTKAGETQQPYVPSDSAQVLDPHPLLAPRAHRAALLSSPTPEVEKQRDESVIVAPPINATVTTATYAEAQQPHTDSDASQLHDPSPPMPSCSHSSTALLPYSVPSSEKGTQNSLVPCTDPRDPQSSRPIDAIACKYTTQSPAWLPPGWITEVQTRRSGSTAGTRDKYYKDLVTGRRFRSRNEVIHFLQTGKGRLRKRRRKKAIASSVFGGPHNLISHQPHSLAHDAPASPCLFLAPQPLGFVLGPLVNSRPVHTAHDANVPAVPGSAVEGVDAPSQTPNVHPTTSSIPGGLKQQMEERPQKLPVQRKAKTLSPNKSEDKQASRLWQWLQKPVARMMEQPQRQDIDKEANNDGKNVEDSSRETRTAQRRTQLSKEIEVAQKTVMHLGKEMQATVEKLTQEIQTAQLETQASHVLDDVMGNVIQAANRLDSAMGNVTQATQNLVIAINLAIQASQLSDSNMGAASISKQPQVAAASVRQEVTRPDVAMAQSPLRGYATHAVERPDLAKGCSSHAVKQPQVAVASGVQEPLRPNVAVVLPATGGCITQTDERPDLAMGYFMQAHRMLNGVMSYATEAAQRTDITRGHIIHLNGVMGNPKEASQRLDIARRHKTGAVQLPDITILNGVMGNANEASQRPDLARGHMAKSVQMPDVTILNGVMGKANEASQRPDLVRGYVTQAVQMPDVTMNCTIQEAQMAAGGAMCNSAKAPQSPLVVTSSDRSQATERIDVATGMVDGSSLTLGELSRDMHAYQKAVELSKQIVEARNRHFTNKKFAALNPKLDLSMFSPSLSSRQKAKVVQKMKAKHARGLLVVLGRKLCLKALRKAAMRML